MLKKGMGKSILMTVLITGNVIWGGTVVYAEEGLQQFNLDQMVVTATRTMKELQEVPSSVSVVTSQDIEERNINSVPEALQTLPGVYMNQAAQGEGRALRRRGHRCDRRGGRNRFGRRAGHRQRSGRGRHRQAGYREADRRHQDRACRVPCRD